MQTTEINIWPDGKKAYTKTWWVTFANGVKARCFEGEPDDVESRAKEIGAVRTIRSLPYPAEPRDQPNGPCPSFCYTPSSCQGRTSCPKNYACSE
jgi:hypothetical protein